MKTILVDGEPVDYSGLPETTREGMQRYMENGIKPGVFLMAVLSNDLMTAIAARNDPDDTYVYKHAHWLRWYAPHDSFGSPEMVWKWIASFQKGD